MTSAAGGGREDHIAAPAEPGTRLIRKVFFFSFFFLSLSVSLSVSAMCCCAAWWQTGRRRDARFSQSSVFTCKQELHMLRLVPTSQHVGPPSTQSHLPSQACTLRARQNGRKQNIKLARNGCWGGGVV